MLGKFKHFIRKKLDNEKHPTIHSWFAARDERRFRENYERHQRMNYAEIEAEINATYKAIFGRKINWDNPQTFNEKMQIAKLYMPTPLKTRLADKYLVREWISGKIGGDYLIPLLGVYESFDQINFDALPDKFVIKCTHDCGSSVIVKDKKALDLKALKLKYDELMKVNYAWHFFEMHYKDMKPKIIIEKYLGSVMNEYKFYCFGGKPYCCFVTFGERGVNLSINFYDMDWNLCPFTREDKVKYTGPAPRPAMYDAMKDIAAELCRGIDHVRVDLYVVDGRIYNGEMTFTTCGGFGKLTPDEWDYKLGSLWPFDSSARQKVLASHSRP